MNRFICLFLFFPAIIFGQRARSEPLTLEPNFCEVKLTADVLVGDMCYTFWVSYGGPCVSIRRYWVTVLTVLLPSFLEDVLGLFPDQQPEIVSWSVEWG